MLGASAPGDASDGGPETFAKDPAAPTPADPDLARVVTTWPGLPLHIKAAVMALVKTAGVQQ